MRGRIITSAGECCELPELLRWELCCTLSVPCDSFEAECGYDAAMLETLKEAQRFAFVEEGEEIFRGVVDEFEVCGGGAGLTVKLCGRGMAALLLDNETRAVSYQKAKLSEILRCHAEPYGIAVEAAEELSAEGLYKVAGGSSEWKALADFTRRAGNFAPRMTMLGALRVTKEQGGRALALAADAPIVAARYRDRRYGVISEVEVLSRGGSLCERVENEKALARGHHSRRVLYSTAASREEMRAAGEQQIERSKEEAKLLTLEIAQGLTAEPFDMIEAELPALGIAGTFRVREVLRKLDDTGETTQLKLEEV